MHLSKNPVRLSGTAARRFVHVSSTTYGCVQRAVNRQPPTVLATHVHCSSPTSMPDAPALPAQACSLEAVEDRLRSWGVPFVQNVFFEDGVRVGQVSNTTAACSSTVTHRGSKLRRSPNVRSAVHQLQQPCTPSSLLAVPGAGQPPALRTGTRPPLALTLPSMRPALTCAPTCVSHAPLARSCSSTTPTTT